MTSVSSPPAARGSGEFASGWKALAGWSVGIVLGVLVWFVHVPQLTEHQRHGAALIIATIAWWLLSVAPQGVIGILFVVLVVLLGVEQSTPLLAQAWTSSNIWFVFASFGFGFIVSETTLGERLTYGLLRYFCRSFWRFGVFIILAGAVLSLIGMAGDFGRMGILYPMVAVAAAAANTARRTQSTRAMAMMILGVGQPTLMYVYNGFWLNQTFLGLAKSHVNYVQWIVDFTLPSVLLSALNVVAIRFLFPDRVEIPPEVCRERLRNLDRLAPRDWRVLGFLLLAVVLWVTSIWTGLDAGWIAMGVFALMLLPGIGVMTFKNFVDRMNWNVVFFLTGAFALGSLMHALKLAPVIEHWLVPSSMPHNAYLLGIVVAVWSMLIHLFTGDAASAMAVTVPVFTHVAIGFHLNPLVFGYIAYMSIFTQYFFLYQNAGTVFAYGYGMFSAKDVLKFGIASVFTTVVALSIGGVAYWQIIGLLH